MQYKGVQNIAKKTIGFIKDNIQSGMTLLEIRHLCEIKLMALVLAMACAFALTGCGKKDTYTIKITVPAGTTEEFVYQEDFIYSEEEISPRKKQLTMTSIDISDDTEVVLKAIEVKQENAYEPTHFTKGIPLTIDVEKGAWFKIGIAMQNPTDEDIVVCINVENVKVRIE